MPKQNDKPKKNSENFKGNSGSGSGGTGTSFQNTPQAGDDNYLWNEDSLLASDQYAAGIITLDVLDNDKGGNAKHLYSLDDFGGSELQTKDAVNGVSAWEQTAQGNLVRINNGQVELDIRPTLSVRGLSSLNALAAGETLADSFTYTIQMGNGTLSQARVEINIGGSNDSPEAVNDLITLPAGSEQSLDILANDSDTDKSDVLTITEISSSRLGTATITADGSKVNFVTGGSAGFERLTYTMSDGQGGTSSAEVFLVVGVTPASGSTLTLGSDGDDLLDLSDRIDNITIAGLAGDDTIIAGSGDDLILWSAGDGNDTVEGGAGWDHMFIDLSGPESELIDASQALPDYGIPGPNPVDDTPPDFEEPPEPIPPNPGPDEDVTTYDEPPVDPEDEPFPDFGDESERPVDPALDDIAAEFLAAPVAWQMADTSAEFDDPDAEPEQEEPDYFDEPPAADAGTLTAVDGKIILSTPDTKLTLDGIEDISIRMDGDGLDMEIGDLTGTDIAEDTVELTGNDLNNRLNGSAITASKVIIKGLGGNDTLIGGALDDTLAGGNGDDKLDGRDGDDVLDGGAGTDTAYYSLASAGVWVRLYTEEWQNTRGAGTDKLISIENLSGSAYADRLWGDEGANTIEGRNGDDAIDGRQGSDLLIGGNGNDKLYGNSGNDWLRGGSGDDYLSGGSNGDLLEGGSGSDILDGGSGNDTFIGGSGIDYASFASSGVGVTASLADALTGRKIGSGRFSRFLPPKQQDTGSGLDTINRDIEGLIGSRFNDTLTGSSRGDRLQGGGGNDTLNGGNGDDLLDGGDGDDLLDGGAGIDTLSYATASTGIWADLAVTDGFDTRGAGIDTYVSVEVLEGSSHNDKLWGNAQNDDIRGGEGDDTLDGRDGNDILFGDDGRDHLIGNAGDDQLIGGNSNDLLEGGVGNDKLFGQSGHDTLRGGDGDDLLDGGPGNDILDGGAGVDTVNYYSVPNYVWVNLSLTTAQNTKTAGSDTLLNIENVVGSNFNDRIWGNSDANYLRGMGGNDIIDAGAGDDTLDGGGGNDRLKGGDGDDLFIASNGRDILEGGAGSDTVDYSRYSGPIRVDLRSGLSAGVARQNPDIYNSIENIIGTNNPNSVFRQDRLVGNDSDNMIDGRGGYDRIFGHGGNDRLFGGSGDDDLYGGTGNDELDGGSGINFVYGEDGNDILHARSGLDLLEGGNGNDTFILYNDLPFSISEYDQQLFGGAGNDTVDYGNTDYPLSADLRTATITRHLGNFGWAGFDFNVQDDISSIEGLKGSRGNDNIGGTSGNNLLWGNEGDDTINGYGGIDTVDGGAGNDTINFDFNTNAGGNYSGGTGIDTLVVNLTSADMANTELRHDLNELGLLLRIQQTLDSAFLSIPLTVSSIENMVVNVDGIENDDPQFSSASTFNVDENSLDVATLEISDTLIAGSYFKIVGGPDAGLFSLNEETGALSFISAPDFETPLDRGGDNTYWLAVVAGDGLGAFAFQDISVTVLDQFEAPENQAPTVHFNSNNLLANGSFEQPAISGAFVTNLNSGINNWTITGTNVDIIRSFWPASEGQQSIDLNGSGPGGLSQTVNTVAGMSYTVAFDLSKNSGEGSSSATVQVSADGQSDIYTFSGASTNSDMLWAEQGFSFVADDTSATLNIASESPSASGPALDNVRLLANGLVAQSGVATTLTGLSVADVDAGDSELTLALAVDHGSLVLAASSGLTLLDGDGSDGSLLLQGSVSSINNALSGLFYTASSEFTGTDQITLTANDGGVESATLDVELLVQRGPIAHSIINLVSDGSFESPATTSNITLYAGEPLLPSWNIEAGSVDVVGSGTWQAADGQQSLDMNGYAPGTISQPLSTSTDGQYTVIFNLSKNTWPEIASMTATVALSAGNDSETFSFSGTTSATDMRWASHSFNFSGTGNDTLSISSLAPSTSTGGTNIDASGPAIDNVVVVENRVINDFRIGTGGDTLKLGQLLESLGAPQDARVFSEGWLDFDTSSGMNTSIRLDTTGGGNDYVEIISLIGVSLTVADTDNYIL